MQHPLLLFDNWDFIEETYAEVMKRYSGFGARLFDILDESIPGILPLFRFFRSSEQIEDVFAVCENVARPFSVQLEPCCEVICIGNAEVGIIEIGTWSQNEYEESAQYIKENFLGNRDSF